jgi:hypothetical protein
MESDDCVASHITMPSRMAEPECGAKANVRVCNEPYRGNTAFITTLDLAGDLDIPLLHGREENQTDMRPSKQR